MSEQTGLILRPEMAEQVTRCDLICREAREVIRAAESAGNAMTLAMATASGIAVLEDAITPEMMKLIMRLQGNVLGFGVDTDKSTKKPKVYPEDEVKRAFIGAVLQGARPTGGEWMIFGGRPYLHQQVFRRRCEELGAGNIDVRAQRPEMKGGAALVPVVVRYLWDGKPQELRLTQGGGGDNRIGIRVNEGMMESAIIGKAERQALKKLFQKLSGITEAGPDEDPDTAPLDAEPEPETAKREADPPSKLDGVVKGFVAAIARAIDEKGIAGPVRAAQKNFKEGSPELLAIHDAADSRRSELGL